MKNCVIYKITNPSGHSYIGKSTNWKKRYSEYKRLYCKSQLSLYTSFLKYGFENHTFEILMQEIPEEQLNMWEKVWIWAEDTFENSEHLNLTEGGNGQFGWTPSETTKNKISKSLTGKLRGLRTKEHCENMSKSQKGRIFSEQHKQNLRKPKIRKT